MRAKLRFYMIPALLILLTSFLLPADWIILKKNEYQVAFPGNPMADSANEKSATQKYHLYSYTYQNTEENTDSNSVYQLYVTTFEVKLPDPSDKAGVKKLFDNGMKQGVSNVNGKLLSEKEITVGSYPGREIRCSIDDGGGIITTRLILAGQQVFMLLTAADAGKENNAAASRFFNSFTVK